MLRGDEMWCQLFSEPGAGSDLAGLSTRAERDGDQWIVNGQKVWTSNADTSHYGILLARTDPDAPKHRGITYFLVDMATPGIEVRPLRQMTGESHFSEVFLTDVAIPASAILGGPAELGNGWRAAVHTLANERAMIGGSQSMTDIGPVVELARRLGALDDPVVRQELAAAHIRMRIIDFPRLSGPHRDQPGPPAGSRDLGGEAGVLRTTSASWPRWPRRCRARPACSTTTTVARRCSAGGSCSRRRPPSPVAPTKCSARSSASACSGFPASSRRRSRPAPSATNRERVAANR